MPLFTADISGKVIIINKTIIKIICSWVRVRQVLIDALLWVARIMNKLIYDMTDFEVLLTH